MMRQPRFLLSLAVALFVGSGACSRHRQRLGYDADAPIVVVVQNNNRQDVDVLVYGDGGQRRLGTIVANTTQTFSVSANFVGPNRELALRAEPIAARQTAIQVRVIAYPGQEVRWMLESPIGRSFISVH